MNEPCIDVELIADVMALPANDARRQHVESCPRCRNLARSYAEFLRAEAGAGADPVAARERLAAVIQSTVGRDGRETTQPRGLHAPHPRKVWRLRAASLVAAAAAIAIVAVALWQDHPTTPSTLRSGGVARAGAPLLFPAVAATDGSVELTWTRAGGADGYEVRMYDSELNEIYRTSVITDTSIVIQLSYIKAPADSPGLAWRVVALRGADIVGTSPPGSIQLP